MRKAVIWFGILDVLLLTIFWALFYSKNLANAAGIIKLRRSYSDYLVKPVYPIEIMYQSSDGSYVYRLNGILESLDADKRILWASTSRGQKYGFYLVPPNELTGIISVTVVGPSASRVERVDFRDDVNQVLTPGSLIALGWKDSRKLTELSKLDGSILNGVGANAGMVAVIKYEN